MSGWTLSGYEVGEMLGFGATGEVWGARDLATGELVALKRLRAGAEPAALEALRREADLLVSIDSPYVVRLRKVVGDVLVLDHAAGGSLAALLSRRGCLEPGEVVTVAAPIASALAAAHAAGFVHGDVSPSNVLFTGDGMPLLSDLGVARKAGDARPAVAGTAEYVDPVVATGGPPVASSDVWALAAVCHHLLSGSPPHDGGGVDDVLSAAVSGERAPLGLLAPAAPRALVAVVESALSADPARRPTAAAFAVALQRAQAAAPVRLHGAPPAAAPMPDMRETHVMSRPAAPLVDPVARRRRRPSLAALAATAVVLVLLVVGLSWARRGEAPGSSPQALPAASLSPATLPGGRAGEDPAPTPAPSADSRAAGSAGPASPSTAGPAAPSPPGTGWAQVLADLDGVRERAFAHADPALLTQVYVPGSPPAVADASAITALAAARRTASDVRHDVRRVQQMSLSEDRAQLRVVDVLVPQVVHDAQGAVVQSRPGRGETTYDVLLLREAAGWRIAALQQV